MASNPNYPVTAGFDGPLQIARWRVIGNPFMAIPHLFLLFIFLIGAYFYGIWAWFSALFTGTVPPAAGAYISGVLRYQLRVQTFQLFLREDYPTFGLPSGYAEPGGDRAWLNVVPPQQFSRAAVFFRGFMVLPLAIVGIAWYIGLYVAYIVGFFGVLITGSWPAGMRSLAIRVLFWGLRVVAWYYLLTDQYPPFGLD